MMSQLRHNDQPTPGIRARAAWFLLCAAVSGGAFATDVALGPFSVGDGSIPAPWRVERFDAKVPSTRYRLREWEGMPAIEAHADASMAVLARPIEIDLEATPFLCWRWRTDAALQGADMALKSGDDYVARIYVSFSIAADEMSLLERTGIKLARSVHGDQVPDAALNYVWDNRYPPGTRRDNAYTGRVRMIVVRSGSQDVGRWVSERVNVLADFRRAFGNVTARPVALAVATDTDNTGETAHAGFGDLRFVSRPEACGGNPQG
jgi:hypothetical protein